MWVRVTFMCAVVVGMPLSRCNGSSMGQSWWPLLVTSLLSERSEVHPSNNCKQGWTGEIERRLHTQEED